MHALRMHECECSGGGAGRAVSAQVAIGSYALLKMAQF